MPYAYEADIWCDGCGASIADNLRAIGTSDDGDTGTFPQWGGSEAADCPNHCAAGPDCLEAIVLDSGRKVGALVNDSLTDYGVAYVRDAHAARPTEVTALWMESFDLAADDGDGWERWGVFCYALVAEHVCERAKAEGWAADVRVVRVTDVTCFGRAEGFAVEFLRKEA